MSERPGMYETPMAAVKALAYITLAVLLLMMAALCLALSVVVAFKGDWSLAVFISLVAAALAMQASWIAAKGVC